MVLEEKKPTLYIDVDGTLTAWREKAGPDLWMCPDYIWSCERLENVIEAVKLLISRYKKVKFLSASVSEKASYEKKKFLKDIFGALSEEHFIFIPYGKDKSDYVDPAMGILLDDYSVNCLNWEEKGGLAIKLRNNCNAKNGKWKGNSVWYLQKPESIAIIVMAMASAFIR